MRARRLARLGCLVFEAIGVSRVKNRDGSDAKSLSDLLFSKFNLTCEDFNYVVNMMIDRIRKEYDSPSDSEKLRYLVDQLPHWNDLVRHLHQDAEAGRVSHLSKDYSE